MNVNLKTKSEFSEEFSNLVIVLRGMDVNRRKQHQVRILNKGLYQTLARDTSLRVILANSVVEESIIKELSNLPLITEEQIGIFRESIALLRKSSSVTYSRTFGSDRDIA